MGDTVSKPVSAAPGTAQSVEPVPVPPGIDLDQLTEKVYRLLLADLRLEQARRGGKR